jgi:hypothetical protein
MPAASATTTPSSKLRDFRRLRHMFEIAAKGAAPIGDVEKKLQMA